MSSTFDGLYIARSGVRTSRVNLNITGQNITNADTEGYTRQRVDQSSLSPAEYGSFWATSGAVSGNGVNATGTEQLRDEFLDGEFRTQNAKSGESSVQTNTSYDMEDIFTTTTTSDSSSKSSVIDVLSNEYSNFITQLQNLTSGKSDASESAIREEAKLLATKLNSAAKALQTIREQQSSNLTEYGVKAANDLMKGIAALNQRIHDSEVSGSQALELQDQRNVMLDKLSKYVSIKVVKTPDNVGSGRTVDSISVLLADSDGNALKGDGGKTFSLVDGKSYAKFSAATDKKNEDGSNSTAPFDMTHIRLSGLSSDEGKTFAADSGIKNADIKSGTFSGYLKLLNESGEFDTAAGGVTTTARGIGFYTQTLDKIAQQLVGSLNILNCKVAYPPPRNYANITPLVAGYDAVGGEWPKKTDSLTVGDMQDNISKYVTAANIHVSSDWTDGALVTSKDGDGKDSYSNITKMIDVLTNENVNIKTDNGVSVFSGPMYKAFSSVGTMLGQDTSSLQSTDTTNSNLLNSVERSRESISSVSLDDEAISITQYSQSLNAASRFMTVVDECLQTIINNMGLAGR